MKQFLLLIALVFIGRTYQAQTCTVTITNTTPSICKGASAVLTASGATTYSWNTGATTASISVSPTVTTTYTVTGIVGTCTQVVTNTVTVKTLPTIAISPSSPTLCFGSSITLTASGASTYSWNTGATTSTLSVNPSNNTTYTATGTGTNGCSNSASKTVTVNPNLVLTNVTPSICIGSTVALVASGATSYSWNTGATTASISAGPTVTTTYTVTGTTGSCSRTLTTTVYPAAIPNVSISATSLSVCLGNSATLTASGATTYSWSTAATTTSIVVSPTVTTTYTVKGTTDGCAKTVSISITRLSLPTIAIAPTSPTICNGNAITLTASGGSTYTWNTSATTSTVSVSPTVTTSYSVTGTATTGCSNTAAKTVTVSNSIIASPSSGTICTGNSINLSASGSTTYSWSTGATTSSIAVTPTVSTTYTVRGTTGSCVKTLSITISVNPLPNVAITRSTPSICVGGSALLTASGASTYSWSTGATTATISVSPSVTTTYSVIGTSSLGCTKTVTTSIDASCNFTYRNIGYKTRWTNFYGLSQRNDSLILTPPLSPSGWNNAISKNTLKTNADGWAEVIVTPSSYNAYFLGFLDSVSNVSGQYLEDLDYGVYIVGTTLYAINGGYWPADIYSTGDTIKIERVGSSFNLRKNRNIVYTCSMPSNINYKLKVSNNGGGNPIYNIGASFKDSTNMSFPGYVLDYPVIKHSVPGSTNGSISLTVRPSGSTHTYTWSNGSNSASISGLSSGAYSVTVKDADTVRSVQKYNVGYKTYWTNFFGLSQRNDSLYVDGSVYSTNGWYTSISKNTLKSGVDGWSEIVVRPSAYDAYMFGFVDSASVLPGTFYDIDYGFYFQNRVIYGMINGEFGLAGTYAVGDVIRIEREGSNFYLKLNGSVIYSTSMPSSSVYKLKLLNANTPVCNIGASFIDSTNIYFPNYVKNYPIIKHTTPGLNNGSISLTANPIGSTHTYSWLPGGSTAPMQSSLSVGQYTVNANDANNQSSQQKYNVGYKTYWTNLYGLESRNDSLIIVSPSSLTGWNTAISKNTLRSGVDGWSEIVVRPSSYDAYMLGFIDSSSVLSGQFSDMDFGFYLQNRRILIVLGEYYAYLSSAYEVGDVMRVERTGDTFYLKQNGATIYSCAMLSSKIYKLKIINNSNPVCNIGASFMDSTNTNFPNYVQNKVVIKHSSGPMSNDGSIQLTAPSGGYTYTWSPDGEQTATILNKAPRSYSVIIKDPLGNTSNYKYDVSYKTNWKNFEGSILRNDSILTQYPFTATGWNTAQSENILEAHQNGEISWLASDINNYNYVGFIDTASTSQGVFSDINEGVYQQSRYLYYFSNGYYYIISNVDFNDVLKIKRENDTVKFYRNGVLLLTTTPTNTNVDWKIKSAVSTGNYLANVAASFLPGPLSLSSSINNKHYAILNKKLDAGYYNSINNGATNLFYFMFDEEYFSPTSTNLTYKIFNDNGTLQTSTPGLVKAIGDNRFSLNVSSLPTGKYYKIHVYNQKNEVWEGRIKIN